MLLVWVGGEQKELHFLLVETETLLKKVKQSFKNEEWMLISVKVKVLPSLCCELVLNSVDWSAVDVMTSDHYLHPQHNHTLHVAAKHDFEFAEVTRLEHQILWMLHKATW